MNFSSDDTEVPQFPMPGSISASPPRQTSLPDVERDLMRSGGGYRPSRGILATQAPAEPTRESSSPFAEVNPLASQTFRASGTRGSTALETHLKEAAGRPGAEPIGPETLLEIRDLYRSGQRERAFKLLEGFVRAFPHHEPAAKLYRALKLQRQLSSDSSTRNDPSNVETIRTRDAISHKPAPASTVPIVPLGPAEITTPDTPIPSLTGEDALGMPLRFQADDSPALSPATSAAAASDTLSTDAQHAVAPTTGPLETVQFNPTLPDFFLEPAPTALEHAEEPSEGVGDPQWGVPIGAHSSNDLEQEQRIEPIDWTWDSKPPETSNQTGTSAAFVESSPENKAPEWGAPSSSTQRVVLSSEPPEKLELDWGHAEPIGPSPWMLTSPEALDGQTQASGLEESPILGSTEPSTQGQPPADTSSDNALNHDIHSTATQDLQFEQGGDSEEITTETAISSSTQQTPLLPSARDTLHGFFAPSPAMEFSTGDAQLAGMELDSIPTWHDSASDLTADLPSFDGAALIFSSTPHADTMPQEVRAQGTPLPMRQHASTDHQGTSEAFFLPPLHDTAESAPPSADLAEAPLAGPMPDAENVSERLLLETQPPEPLDAWMMASQENLGRETSISPSAVNAFLSNEPETGSASDAESKLYAQGNTLASNALPTQPGESSWPLFHESPSSARKNDIGSRDLWEGDEKQTEAQPLERSIRPTPSLELQSQHTVEQPELSQGTPPLEMRAVLVLEVAKLLHTRFLFTLEERLFLCALDGKRSIEEALQVTGRLPLTHALALLNDLHSEGSVRVISLRS